MKRLLESGARPFGTRRGTALSVILHGLLIVAAVVGTSHTVRPERESTVEEHALLYVVPPPPAEVHVAPAPLPEPPAAAPEKKEEPAPPRPRVERPAPPRPRPAPVAPRPERTQAAAPALPSVAVPTDIPVTIPKSSPIPATNVGAIASAPVPVPAKPAASPASDAAPGGAGRERVETVSSGDVDRAFTEDQVERAVQVTRAGVPKYPESLRSGNVQGEVVLRFIVGTNGRVEPGSIKVVSSPHRSFTDAAREALLDSRFRPAQAGGSAVRQLAEQSFSFRLQ